MSRFVFDFRGIYTCIIVSFKRFVSLVEILRQSNCKLILRFDSTLHLRFSFVPVITGKLFVGIIKGSDISEKTRNEYY